jgi:ABC-type phosphate/phosphonate transport system substrate-binding protein
MIAALPMYDFPWTAEGNDAFWAKIRERLLDDGIAAPVALTRGVEPAEIWRSPELLFGQTCGYPYWTSLRDTVEILAAPVYAFPGCDGPAHCSFLVARADDSRDTLAAFRGARAGVNSHDSNSGMNLFRASIAPLAGGRPFFAEVTVTGAHAASLAAVAEGAAEIAAIDCVSFALLQQGRPALVAKVRILGRTPSSPALPFIASRAIPGKTVAGLRAALAEAADQPALGLRGVAFPLPEAYARVAELEREAAALGYPTLA